MAIYDKSGLLQRLLQKIRSSGIGGLTKAQDVREFLTDLIDTLFSLFGESTDSNNPALAWDSGTVYNTTDNQFAISRLRIFKSKVDNNQGNEPPYIPDGNGIYQDAYWEEVSPAPKSGILGWSAGTYTSPDLTIVYYNDQLIRLDASRPFESTNADAEIEAGHWKVIGGKGTGVLDPVADIAALQALDTTSENFFPDKWAILVEDEGAWYRLDRESSVAETLPYIVAPATGTGRWIQDQKAQLDGKTDKDDSIPDGEVLVKETGGGYTGGGYTLQQVVAGSEPTLFFHSEVLDISGYNKLLAIPAQDAEVADVTAVAQADGEVLIDEFVTEPGFPGLEVLNGGPWHFMIYAAVSSDTGETNIVARVYKRADNGTETELFNAQSATIQGSAPVKYDIEKVLTTISLLKTDRIVIKFFAKTTSTPSLNLTFYYEGTENYSHVHVPFSLINQFLKLKADKATGHVTDNLAKLDVDGNPVDAGVAVADLGGGGLSEDKLVFDSDLTLPQELLYQGSIGAVAADCELIYDTDKLSAVSFETQLTTGTTWDAQADLEAVRSYAAGLADSTLWRLRITPTYASGKTGQATVIIKHI